MPHMLCVAIIIADLWVEVTTVRNPVSGDWLWPTSVEVDAATEDDDGLGAIITTNGDPESSSRSSTAILSPTPPSGTSSQSVPRRRSRRSTVGGLGGGGGGGGRRKSIRGDGDSVSLRFNSPPPPPPPPPQRSANASARVVGRGRVHLRITALNCGPKRHSVVVGVTGGWGGVGDCPPSPCPHTCASICPLYPGPRLQLRICEMNYPTLAELHGLSIYATMGTTEQDHHHHNDDDDHHHHQTPPRSKDEALLAEFPDAQVCFSLFHASTRGCRGWGG